MLHALGHDVLVESRRGTWCGFRTRCLRSRSAGELLSAFIVNRLHCRYMTGNPADRVGMTEAETGGLNESVLGTKKYWNEAYTRESLNYQDDPDDEGTVWFEDTGAEDKMIDYLGSLALAKMPAGGAGSDAGNASPSKNFSMRVLDVGTGNGHFLFALRDAGWDADMIGIDYSEASIKFARQIEEARQSAVDVDTAGSRKKIRFEVHDIFSENAAPAWAEEGFDIGLDKGTFDAISLSKMPVRNDGRAGWEVYAECVAKLMRPGATFLITSCNWTEEELRRWLEGPMLSFRDRVHYPSFTFGGVKGQSVTTLCFERSREACGR